MSTIVAEPDVPLRATDPRRSWLYSKFWTLEPGRVPFPQAVPTGYIAVGGSMAEDFLVEVRVVGDARLDPGPSALTGSDAIAGISAAITDMAGLIRTRIEREFSPQGDTWHLGSLEVSFDLDIGSDRKVVVVRDANRRVMSVKCTFAPPAAG